MPTPTHSALAKTIAESGVSHVFGLLGHGNLMLINNLVHERDVSYIAVNREDSAVSAADAYARVSGRLGVATVTHGPGLTNTMTALHEAGRARTPLLLLVGDTDRADHTHEQDIDQRATIAPTGTEFVELGGTESALEDLHFAMRQAVEKRKPVVFNMPVDAQTAAMGQAPSLPPADLVVRRNVEPDPEILNRALGVLAVARRPLIIAGRGAVTTEARQQILHLADMLNAPVATTLTARGLFNGHPFNLAVFGTLSTPPAIQAIEKSDCLVAFGVSLNRYTTSYGGFTDGKQVIRVDNDAGALGAVDDIVGVLGDAQVTSLRMCEALEQLNEVPPGLRTDDLARNLREHDPSSEFTDTSTSGRRKCSQHLPGCDCAFLLAT